ncbi:MAG: hypothetical protein IH793_11445 [Acidobacteria bacterium]|nr:hypothetical protein [Acidobacteriota bacterium]
MTVKKDMKAKFRSLSGGLRRLLGRLRLPTPRPKRAAGLGLALGGGL